MLRGAQKLLGESLRCRAEVESRTQGSRPRPKTHKKIQSQGQPFRTDPLEAKESNARGLGQGHRRKLSPKEKLFQKDFSGDEQKRNTKRRSCQILRKVSGVLQRNFKGSKKVLSSRTLSLLPVPDAFGMRQQFGEYFAPNSMSSFFSTDFALNFGGQDQKNE